LRKDALNKSLLFMNDPVLVIAGGSGFLGQAILEKYRDTHAKIVVLTRKGASAGFQRSWFPIRKRLLCTMGCRHTRRLDGGAGREHGGDQPGREIGELPVHGEQQK
jgi:hypothetical protein